MLCTIHKGRVLVVSGHKLRNQETPTQDSSFQDFKRWSSAVQKMGSRGGHLSSNLCTHTSYPFYYNVMIQNVEGKEGKDRF